ncbi:MAG: hypothetical protein HY958_09635 [Bacteroidia bacterium]|nr:hypothetical protein [Bacteroidia bacterium]
MKTKGSSRKWKVESYKVKNKNFTNYFINFKNFITFFLTFNFITLQTFNCSCSAQDFNWEAKLGKVEKDGFYKILLKPEITAKLKSDLSDLRIFDSLNAEVAYIPFVEKPVLYKTLFHEYKIIRKEHHADYTRLIIHNPEKKEITNITLIIQNADVRKWLKLNASHDMKEWYVLKANYYFQSIYSDNNTSEIRILNFPLSNYEYYELLVSDYFDMPINILKAGYYDLTSEKGKYSEVLKPELVQKDTLKESAVRIKFSEPQYIDQVIFNIDGPEFYFRNARLCVEKQIVEKKKTRKYFEEIQKFNLSSSSNNTINLSYFKTDEIYLFISNQDDKPLKIKSVEAYQLNHYLTALLKKNMNYRLAGGNEKMKAPVYDLKYFTDSIPKELQILEPGNPVVFNKNVTEKPKPIYLDPKFLWIVISATLLLLVIITYVMIKEMTKKKS